MDAHAPLVAGIIIACLALTLTAAAADTSYPDLGLYANDIQEYVKDAHAIPECREAFAEDNFSENPRISPTKERHLANLYAECRKRLEERHVSAGVLRANNVMLSHHCLMIDLHGGDATKIPACT
jgi:hypothetical protein